MQKQDIFRIIKAHVMKYSKRNKILKLLNNMKTPLSILSVFIPLPKKYNLPFKIVIAIFMTNKETPDTLYTNIYFPRILKISGDKGSCFATIPKLVFNDISIHQNINVKVNMPYKEYDNIENIEMCKKLYCQ